MDEIVSSAEHTNSLSLVVKMQTTRGRELDMLFSQSHP